MEDVGVLIVEVVEVVEVVEMGLEMVFLSSFELCLTDQSVSVRTSSRGSPCAWCPAWRSAPWPPGGA